MTFSHARRTIMIMRIHLDFESILLSFLYYELPCNLLNCRDFWLTEKISTTVGGFFFAAASLINWMSEYVSVPYRIHLNIYQSQAPTFRVCSRKNIWNGCLIYSTVCLVPSTGHSHHNFTSIQTRKINKHDLHLQKKVPTFTVISTPFLLHLKGYFFRFWKEKINIDLVNVNKGLRYQIELLQ